MTRGEAFEASEFLRQTGEVMTLVEIIREITHRLDSATAWEVCEMKLSDGAPPGGWEPFGSVDYDGSTWIQYRRRAS